VPGAGLAIGRIGITTPIVSLNPAGHAPWERDGTADDLAELARCVDELGYHHLTCSEHVAVPLSAAPTRGLTYWDPLATLAFLAAHTTRTLLATHVVVLGYHHPLEVVKRYGTLDRLSGGRVVLGVGVGSLREEFELLGVPFDGRGARADTTLAQIRRSWGRNEVDGFAVSPTSARREVRIWVGGRTRRSLRRAVDLGDGWVPFGLGPEELAAALAAVDRPHGFDVVLWAHGLDPAGAPDRTRRRLEQLERLGATHVNVRFESRDRDHWCHQAAALAELLA
jgi:probable F420-dependent oxidoreductase